MRPTQALLVPASLAAAASIFHSGGEAVRRGLDFVLPIDPNDDLVVRADPNDNIIVHADPNDSLVAREDPNDNLVARADPNDSLVAREDPNDNLVARADPNDSLVARADPNDSLAVRADPNDKVTRDDPNDLVSRADPNDTLLRRSDPNDSLVAREDPNDKVARADPNDNLPGRSDPNDNLVAREDPNDNLVARDDPNDNLVAREDPNDSLVARADPNDNLVAREDPNDNLVTRDDPNDSIAIVKRMADERFVNSNVPLNDADACTAFRALEWLSYSLIELAEKIEPHDADRVFVETQKQGGPLTLVLRGILTWTKLLENLARSLESTDVWSCFSQLQVAECYLDYAFQAASFLQLLQEQAHEFGETEPIRCLTHDRIEELANAHDSVAKLLYGYADTRGLFTGNFPEKIPEWWNSRFEVPKPNQPLRDYVQRNDQAGFGPFCLFNTVIQAWECYKHNNCNKCTSTTQCYHTPTSTYCPPSTTYCPTSYPTTTYCPHKEVPSPDCDFHLAPKIDFPGLARDNDKPSTFATVVRRSAIAPRAGPCETCKLPANCYCPPEVGGCCDHGCYPAQGPVKTTSCSKPVKPCPTTSTKPCCPSSTTSCPATTTTNCPPPPPACCCKNSKLKRRGKCDKCLPPANCYCPPEEGGCCDKGCYPAAVATSKAKPCTTSTTSCKPPTSKICTTSKPPCCTPCTTTSTGCPTSTTVPCTTSKPPCCTPCTTTSTGCPASTTVPCTTSKPPCCTPCTTTSTGCPTSTTVPCTTSKPPCCTPCTTTSTGCPASTTVPCTTSKPPCCTPCTTTSTLCPCPTTTECVNNFVVVDGGIRRLNVAADVNRGGVGVPVSGTTTPTVTQVVVAPTALALAHEAPPAATSGGFFSQRGGSVLDTILG